MFRFCQALLTLVSIFVCPANLFAVESGALGELLTRLETADREVSFLGRYTYEIGGKNDTFEVKRIIVEGFEFEKTINLTGPRHEQVRYGRDTRCLTTSNHLLRGHFLNLQQGGTVSLGQSYKFYPLGGDRVADRPSTLIRVEPRDRFRYGYLISIDNETGLLMRSVITAGRRNALERFQYVSIEPLEGDVLKYLSKEELQELRRRKLEQENASDGKSSTCDIQVKTTSPWRPVWLPGGFVLTNYTFTEQDGHMETYSDGLSVFSVFTSPAKALMAKRGQAQRGASVAFIKSVKLGSKMVHVAVVGEIPSTTASKIVTSMVEANVN